MRWGILLALLVPYFTQGDSVPNLSHYIAQVNPKLTFEQAENLAQTISKYSVANDLDAKFVAAIIAVESGFNPKAVGSSHGEIGLMQLRPEYHLTQVKDIKKRKKRLFDIDTNIAVGVKYIAGLKAVFKDRYTGKGYIEHYNIGPNRKATSFKYTAKVMKYYQMFGGTLVRPTLSQAL